MKRLLAVIVTSIFAAGVNAADIYHGFGNGNPDLTDQRISDADFAGVQPSVGDSVERYQGWAEGNPDLFKASGTTKSTDDPDIYTGVSGNPDLEVWGP